MIDTGLLLQFQRSTKYDYFAIEQYLESSLPTSLDRTFSDLCALYRQADEDSRCAVSQSLNEGRTAWLNVFAYRMAMLTVRRQSANLLNDALTALLIIANRDDRHNFLMTLSVVHHSATTLGDPGSMFRDVVQYACDVESADLLLEFLERTPQDKRIEVMGYREVIGPHGVIYPFGKREIPAGWE
jgi:hypothetical protein